MRHQLRRFLCSMIRIKRNIRQWAVENSSDPEQIEVLNEVVSCLRSGGVVAIPTDTIYGLATMLDSSEKVYRIKGRIDSKPVALCVHSLDDIFRYSQATLSYDQLNLLLPGPVTLLFERNRNMLPNCVNPEAQLVGFRIPDHYFVNELCKKLGQPICLTSANVSNAQSSLSIEEFRDLWSDIDLIVDGGPIPDGPSARLGSTVVDLRAKGTFKFVRDGCDAEQTRQTLLEFNLNELTS